jgi:enoyl-CoA hydratase/carnithine racemase
VTPLLKRETHDAVLRLTLNDPTTRNSLSEAMLSELSSALELAEKDTRIAAIIIAAEAPVFCAGHNLKQLHSHRSDADLGAAYFKDLFEKCAGLMLQITQHRCAIIAEVDGLASAAGCQLVASCDLAYASRNAKFCTPGVNIGLFCSTPMVALSRNVGAKQAMEMLLTGDIYDADHALRIGLVNAVVEPAHLQSHVQILAQKIATKSGTAISYGKKLFSEQRDLSLHEAYTRSAEVMAENMLHGSACEGISAFIEKRKPHW